MSFTLQKDKRMHLCRTEWKSKNYIYFNKKYSYFSYCFTKKEANSFLLEKTFFRRDAKNILIETSLLSICTFCFMSGFKSRLINSSLAMSTQLYANFDRTLRSQECLLNQLKRNLKYKQKCFLSVVISMFSISSHKHVFYQQSKACFLSTVISMFSITVIGMFSISSHKHVFYQQS